MYTTRTKNYTLIIDEKKFGSFDYREYALADYLDLIIDESIKTFKKMEKIEPIDDAWKNTNDVLRIKSDHIRLIHKKVLKKIEKIYF